MKKISFNDQWKCYPEGLKQEASYVTLPHDAMLYDNRSETSPGGVNTGWYDARNYIYEKEFQPAEEWSDRQIYIEFEGIYKDASIYLNGEKIAEHDYGYTGFHVNLTKYIKPDQINHLLVKVINQDQPNSRWYSGTGIYRPVWLYLLPSHYIYPDSFRITTIDWKNPRIQVNGKTNISGTVTLEIRKQNTLLVQKTVESNTNFCTEIPLPDAALWSPESPELYLCRAIFEEDIQETFFGIRMISCTPENGFCINGERIILRGACVHHDNGILGACAYPAAEYRKVRLLKENGYNAIRSAHNPCSKSFLHACDKLGMLVIDEYTDMWYIHKTRFDYADKMVTNYMRDSKDIVTKDYNHPSVIMYSTGNEVSETAQKKGIRLCQKLTDRFHELDSTRPVTCGINIFFNFLSSMGFGVYSDKKAQKEGLHHKKKAVGSEFFNNLAGLLGSDFMKFGATLYPCDLKTRNAFNSMDVAGYNYGIRRYSHDLKKYPERIILGSETFCSDIAEFMSLAEKEPRLIGDFVWSGIDYLGETGIGAQEYKEYAPRFDHGFGWLTAGAGRLDLTGKATAEMKYTQVVFGLEPIGIGVIPPNHFGEKHSPSAWRMTNAVESWSWNGCNGNKTQVEVYSKAEQVALYLNGNCIGTKKTSKNCRAIFNVIYQDGELSAIAYDKDQHVLAKTSLKTAAEETILTLIPELTVVHQPDDLCYIRMKYTDSNGIVKPLIRGDITLQISSGKLLGIGSACPFNPKGYLGNTTDTYYGEALAVIQPQNATHVLVKATSPHGNTEILIPVERQADK